MYFDDDYSLGIQCFLYRGFYNYNKEYVYKETL